MNQYTGAAEGDDASKDLDLVGQDQGHPHATATGDGEQDAPIGEEDVLPEERFHRADMVSQQMIDTREKQRKEKASAVRPPARPPARPPSPARRYCRNPAGVSSMVIPLFSGARGPG